MAAWRYQNFSSRVEKYVSCSFAFFNIRREIPWNELTKEFVIFLGSVGYGVTKHSRRQ